MVLFDLDHFTEPFKKYAHELLLEIYENDEQMLQAII